MSRRNTGDADEILHAADVESLERRIMDLALRRTGAEHGAIFLWDPKAKGLALDFHVVDGRVVNLPNVVLRRRADGRANGIAFLVHDRGEPYLCRDAESDPNYARYFLDVRSIAAVPIPWQGRPIGVVSVSSRKPAAFDAHEVAELEALAESSAKFLRRAQLFRRSETGTRRPFLIKGMSPGWRAVEERIERVSPTDAPVLLHGESGTGKELVAHAIHFNSRRASEALVTVNCAAIPETMLESLLFGHVRGAFTGATFDKVGEFQKAHRGTLFLDEIGELPLALQAKVLRAIEHGEIQPLGSNDPPRRVDVRLICATHRDLPALVRARQFRDDLYYRLSVMTLELPALRTYKEGNLEVLAQVFLHDAAKRHGRPIPRLSAEAFAALCAYDYPGNVRELKNAVEHAVILAADDEILPRHLPATMTSGKAPAEPSAGLAEAEAPYGTLRSLRESWLAPHERRYLADLLDSSRGNVRAAARRAGVDAVTFYRLLKKRGIRLGRRVDPV
jgi:two-component system response regulator HydG